MKFLNLEDEAERSDRIMAKPDPERIWLSPKCEEVGGDRTWCSVPQDCENCNMRPVEYIRADLVKSNTTISDYVAVIEKAQAERDAMAVRLAGATKLIEEGNLAMATLINHETALRRIKSLDEKNVPKYAQVIAREALANNLITVTPEAAMHADRLGEIIRRCTNTGDYMLSLQDAHALTEAACFLAGE